MLVVPGEYVAEAEEYVPGYGVYEDDALYSKVVGDLVLDSREHVAKVLARTRIPKMQSAGIITVGRVSKVQDQMIMLDLSVFNSKKFSLVPPEVPGILLISSVSDKYVEDLREMFKVGDIVRVKVVKVTPYSVIVRTDERNLGVIKAYCSKCRRPLLRRGRTLICPECGNRETRKMAIDYGKWKLL